MTNALEQDEHAEFFATLETTFERAVQSVGECAEKDFVLAGRLFRLRSAGSLFISKILPAITHLEIGPKSEKKPDLTINIWDNISTGTRLPLLLRELIHSFAGCWAAHLGPRGDILRFNTSRFSAAFHPGPNILSVYDHVRKLGLYWREEAASLPYFECGSPIRTLLHWWMTENDCQFVHAGAVGLPKSGVLLVGKGGSGKSTTTLACLRAGLGYAGDDYCLVSMDSYPVVHCVYNTIKLIGSMDLARFPTLRHQFQTGQKGEKALSFLHQNYPDQIISSMPIQSILSLEISQQPDTHLEPISPSEALKALAPSTLAQLPGAGKAAMKILSQLVCQVPCFRLILGRQIEQIPQIISPLIKANE